MMNPTRYTLGATDTNGNQGLYPNDEGDLVKFSTYVELVAHAIEGAANKEFLERQVPELKKALVKILTIASATSHASATDDADEIMEIASKALSQ